jgi:aspartate/methionine/tyrosine aminotransferase
MIRQLFDRALPGSINLGLGEPDLPTPDVIRRAAVRVVTEEQNGYTTHAGLPALRELVAADNSSIGASAEDVIITAGSQEALYLALMTLIDEGDEVLIPDPGFVAYPTITRMAGGITKSYRMSREQGFAFDPESFKRSLTPKTRVVVCISPSNPTGRVLSREDLAAMTSILEGTGIYVLSDEIYRELYFGSNRPASISEFYPRTLVIGGLSKSMSMTGWRIGWLYGPGGGLRGGLREVVRSALVLHGYVTTCASTVSQKAGLAAWTDEAEAARERHRDIFRERRDFLVSALRREAGLEAIEPEGAFYSMVDTRAYGNSIQVAEAMLEARVITVPGAAFGAEGEGYLRVSFCAEEEILSEGVRRMKAALESLKGMKIRQ